MSRIRLGEPAWIYALINPTLPGLVKVGQTTLDPHERARQLSTATAAATPFHVAYAKWADDGNAAEAKAHEILGVDRVNDGREFFKVSLYRAVSAIDLVCGGFSELSPRTPFAELFSSFPDDGEGRELTEDEQAKCRELEKRTKVKVMAR